MKCIHNARAYLLPDESFRFSGKFLFTERSCGKNGNSIRSLVGFLTNSLR
ncbi:protein of unknown function [Methylorubrum extorquens]|uniref:Uncharacterized protein n=1 Tax=Methylorubrum extorquens TaxID=408 RepID=A0A2N9AWQ5_METEX|nr:protein of unknown function [Methylorubrum extorquens]